MFKAYLWLAKPGIIAGNLITATGGFLLASRGSVDLWLLLATLTGIALIIGSGCVVNNYIDRNIDKKMTRTKNRALAKGAIPGKTALAYAAVLGGLGFLVLALFTNALAVGAGLLGLFFYVVMYSVWKRRSPFGTVVGSVSGATPILAGYLAASGRLDTGAVLVFLILMLWQMPHFYAIAMYRQADYAAAGLPVLPVRKGAETTKLYIVAYIGAFIAAVCALAALGYAGYTYFIITVAVGSVWLWKGTEGFKTTRNAEWARSMFRFSLRVIIVFSIMISVDHFLP